MSSGRARSALSESLLGRVSQHRQAVHSSDQPQSVSLDITSSPRDSGEGSFEGRLPMDHRNTPFYGSPWPHLLNAGQAGSFRQRASMPARPRESSPSRIQRGFGEPPPIFARDPQQTTRAASLDTTQPMPDTIPERRLSRVSFAASEGRDASSTDGHSDSVSQTMGYWDTNGAAGDSSPPKGHSLGNELLYGLINTIVSIPAMISFAAIIFQSSAYQSKLDPLAKLALFASAIHQLVFTLKSTLPFAVGQVQDVGLIFLSAMASSIANICLDNGHSKAEALGTSLLTLAICTSLVGLGTFLIGQFRLATLVQYVPLPVVAGYLAFVGLFCLQAGLALAAGVEINMVSQWANLWAVGPALKALPAFATALGMMWVMRNIRNAAALPCFLITVPLIFHAVLFFQGITLHEAADAGWVSHPTKGAEHFWDVYRLFNIKSLTLEGIYLPAMWVQIPKLLGLFFVVAFGSSLDIAAIQAEMPTPLDFNSELKTVGLSNALVGLVGAGFTGSYIFSQTLFALRGGVSTKIQGFVIAISQASLFFLPISVVQYVPNFYFGALLMVFGIEILFDWLVAPFGRVSRAEYLLLWGTFLAIVNTNLEVGIAAGIVAATLYFAYAYAKVHVTAFTVVPCRSGVVRSPEQRAVLELLSGRMAAVCLSGYIFFGSSITISHKVAAVADEMLSRHDGEAEKQQGLCRSRRMARSASALLDNQLLRPRIQATLAHAPCFVLLDLKGVQGLDATAAQTFGTMWNSLHRSGVELVLTHMGHGSTRRLLEAHGITSAAGDPKDLQEGACRSFDSMEEGAQYCEERLLEVAVAYKLCRPPSKRMTLEETLRAHVDLQHDDLQAGLDLKKVAGQLRDHHLKRVHYEAGDVIFSPGDPSDDIYIIEEGSVSMKTNFVSFTNQDEQPVSVCLGNGQAEFEQTPSAPDRKFEFGPGSIMGTTDFFLKRHRSYSITCSGPTQVYRLSRSALPQLSASDPQMLNLLLMIILRTSFLDSSHVLEVLERSNAAR